ncbi:hypothetical protein [Thalassoglobus sp.]|uniref:hypothetical protein n=1 Tax=Thalassoglobus sp. TaxID=2795869 RepID=UPI003AA95B9E
MKKFVALALLLGATTITNAREPIMVPAAPQDSAIAYQADYSPTPAQGVVVDDGLQPVPAGSPIGTIVCDSCDAQGIELYRNVKVIQARKIHPCAVPKIVQVPNPCYDRCNPCGKEPECVFVEICVPPCACEEVSICKDGRRTKFDYGKYGVKVTNRRGTLVINYDS